MTINYHPIGGQIVMRADLAALSGRDKSMLLRALLDEAGIEAADYKRPFDEVFQIMSDNLWRQP